MSCPRWMTVRAVLATVALASVLTGAAAQPAPQLMVWINGDKGYNGLQKVGDRFTARTGVKVVVQHPESATDKFQQAVAAGKGPDVFCWPHDRIGEWAKGGLIVPVRPSGKVRGEIEDLAWQAFTFQGKTWGYPLAIETVGLIYNKALVSRPPASWDEVVRLDRELRAKGASAILWDYNKSFFTWGVLAAAGGYVFGRDAQGNFDTRKIGVNAPGAIRGAEVLEGLIRNGQMPRGARYANMEAGFNQGRIAMMISGPWAWENARRSKIEFGVAPLPAVDGQPAKPFVGVLGCMIAAPSRVKDSAREFIEHHLLLPENLRIIDADVPLGVPANKQFYAELSANPNIRATMESARNGVPIPNIPEMSRFWAAMDAALEAVTNGLQPPRDALNAAAARLEAR
ncbi:MAG TPA: maltose/maltodextrin ABC transporter substrate-binding protein MalE [Burkholderiaceae bacterium]|nr:maltose/maltodextrin ABC transporter substrate-binding protein MalE [Burkholderiaceae bacterium]